MPILACPDCDHQFRVADLPPGTPVRCTNCKCQLKVPERPLRKRTVVEGHIGGRSDYIDAEDFGPVPVKRTRDRAEIQLNNTFTVLLLVGTTALTIAVLLLGGWVIVRDRGRGVPAVPVAANAAPPPADAPAPPPADVPAPADPGPMADLPGDPDAAWAKLQGTWEGEREVRKNGFRLRVSAKLRFTADRKMVVDSVIRDADGKQPDLTLGVTAAIEKVELSDGYIVLTGRITEPVPAVDVTYYRFAPDGRLVSAKVPKRGDQPEAQTLSYNRLE